MATYIVKCFGSMADCFYGTGEWHPPQHIPASQPIPDVILDTSTMGEFFWHLSVTKCHSTQITNSWVKPSKLIWYVTFCFVSGQEAVVVKNGSRLCGTGAARASTPILQNKAYWEIKLQQSGIWSCGLGNPSCDLTKNLGEDQNSWALTHENVLKVNGNIEHKIESKIQEGDIIVSGQKTFQLAGHNRVLNQFL